MDQKKKALGRGLEQLFNNEILDFDAFENSIVENAKEDDIKEIARRMLKSLQKRTEDLGITLSFTDDAIEELAKEGFDKIYGARPLRRAIQSKIEDRLSELILDKTITENSTCTVDYKDNEFTFNS